MYYLSSNKLPRENILALRISLVFGLFDATVGDADGPDCGKENNEVSLMISDVK